MRKVLGVCFILSSLLAFQNCSSGFNALSFLSDDKSELISLSSSLEGSVAVGVQDFQVLTDSFHAMIKLNQVPGSRRSSIIIMLFQISLQVKTKSIWQTL